MHRARFFCRFYNNTILHIAVSEWIRDIICNAYWEKYWAALLAKNINICINWYSNANLSKALQYTKKNKNNSNNHDYTETLLRICTFLLGYFFFGHSAEVVVGRIPNSSVLWSISNIFRKYGVEHIMFRNSI